LLGLQQNFTTHSSDLTGHAHKILTVDFHPTASNILVSGSGDNTMKIWDLNKEAVQRTLKGFGDSPSTPTWNYLGNLIAVLSKEGKIRIFDPRQEKVVQEGSDIPGSKVSKIEWLGKTDQIFSITHKATARTAVLYDSKNMGKEFASHILDNSSSILNPHFDMDTGVMMLWGKGDGSIRFFEINDKAPYVHALTDYTTSVPQVGVAVLHKSCINVRDVEIARVLKLTQDSVEPIQFIVPRQRKELFQDDLLPPTRAAEPASTAEEWLSGANNEPKTVSLRPPDMKPLSEAPKLVRKIKKYVQEDDTWLDPEKTKKRVLDKFHEKMQEFKEEEKDPIPGDDLEGCDSDEWSD